LSEPIWLDRRAALAANQKALTLFGGPGDSTFDPDRLAGALQRAPNAYHYRDPKPDIVELAAIYVMAICKAHAFVDGNKRTAFITCYVFLGRNGFDFNPPTDEAVELFVKAADDKHSGIGEHEVADWIRRHARPVKSD
jgi:death-on-curing protein